MSFLATQQEQQNFLTAVISKLTALAAKLSASEVPRTQTSAVRYLSEQQSNARVLATVSVTEYAKKSQSNVISWAGHGFAVGNLMTALDNAGNRVVASVTAVTTDTFTIGATVADGIVWAARVPRFIFGQASTITSATMETVAGATWLSADVSFDANARAGTTFDLSFPKPSYWVAPMTAARQNIDQQTVFGIVYTRDYPDANTARLRFSNLNNPLQTTSIQIRF